MSVARFAGVCFPIDHGSKIGSSIVLSPDPVRYEQTTGTAHAPRVHRRRYPARSQLVVSRQARWTSIAWRRVGPAQGPPKRVRSSTASSLPDPADPPSGKGGAVRSGVGIQELLVHHPVTRLLETLSDFSGVRQCEPPQIVGALLPRIFQSEGALDRATGFVLLPSLIIRQQRLELIFAQRLCDAFGGMCRSN